MRAAALVAAALLCFWGFASLWFPLGRDQGVFLWIADVLLDGGSPYRDAWETKGPAVFAISAVVRAVTGDVAWGIRLFDAATVAITIALCLRMLRAAGTPLRGGGAVALAVLAVAYTRLDWWDSAQPDGWATTCMTTALATALRASSHAPGRRRMLLLNACGVLVGTASLVKPFYALFVVVPAVPLFVARTLDLRAGVAIVAGAVAAAVTAGIWMMSGGVDVLEAFIAVHLRFNAEVYAGTGGAPVHARLGGFGRSLASNALIAPVTLAMMAPILLRSRSSRDAAEPAAARQRGLVAACAAWLLLAIVWVLMQGKFWPYQWIPAFPPMAILAAVSIATIAALPAWPRERRAAFAWLLLPVLFIGAMRPATVVAAWMRDVVIRRDGERWHSHFGPYGVARGELPAVAAYLRRSVPAGESVLVWGMEPVVYALSGRRPASRYGVHLPLVLGSDTPRRRAERARFIVDMAARPPARIVILDGDRNQLVPASSRSLVSEIPQWAALLARSYEADTIIGNATILRRR